jgi:hypothetical protein
MENCVVYLCYEIVVYFLLHDTKLNFIIIIGCTVLVKTSAASHGRFHNLIKRHGRYDSSG